MTTEQYISALNQRYKIGNTTEHTFRGELAQLIETLLPDVIATNEPKRQKCGAPDYILTKKDIPIGYIETKNIGDDDLEGKKKSGNKEQFDRYKTSLENLIFTDYLNFYFYRNEELITQISIGALRPTKGGEKMEIIPIPENFLIFENHIKDFATDIGQTIKSPKQLAKMMAGRAQLLANVIEKALTSDEDNFENSSLKDQKQAFKQILIHDITPKGFADVYAQTLAYGMFAARLHDPTLETFSRQEAAELIPKSNPFLRKLFGYIAGPDIDDRIKWIVDDLVNIFLACNVEVILKNYGKSTQTENPIIHFYETFLSEYDPKLRKARGVWYTPAPVVNFIVRAVDDILKTEFDLPLGLADTSKTKIKVKEITKATPDQRSALKEIVVEKEVHKVQILDPATGTGTFLAEVVKHIHNKFAGQQGIWSSYVEQHLLPRLNGFELLMASYAMAHLQMDLLLTETGYKPTSEQRFRIFLTNSLEEYNQDVGSLFASWLSDEANQANRIKRDTPVMCIIGNPPYSVSSQNRITDEKGNLTWIGNLIADYKKGLNEKSYNSLSDDYVKFIRYGQYYIEKNGSGVLAFISNNSFIDGIVFRQMRNNLLHCFDSIYILDLHGNSKKKETAPDGTVDQNVFDIMQGVSINIFIKTGKKKANQLGKVFHFDLFGKRDLKYEYLCQNNLKSIDWQQLQFDNDNCFFVPKDFEQKEEYEKGFSTNELFIIGSSGIKTERDIIAIQFTKTELINLTEELKITDIEDFRKKYNLKVDGRDWKLHLAKEDLIKSKKILTPIIYRPFDFRYTYYTGKTKGFHAYPRKDVSDSIIGHKNYGLINLRQNNVGNEYVILITKLMTEKGSLVCGNYFINPLYYYPETTAEGLPERTPNLNRDIVAQIAKHLELKFTDEKVTTKNTFAPIDILDYIYAVLHSPTYREKYKEFLKIDFPRVPYPNDKKIFWKLVKLGGELRSLHLLESPDVENYITQYPIAGNNIVEKVGFLKNKETTPEEDTSSSPYSTSRNYNYHNNADDISFPQSHLSSNNDQQLHEPETEYQSIVKGKVHINDTQYFDNVPEIAWNFYIGGYQPAQKWLKDRKGRTLNFEDILHYQKIIVALTQTDRIMKAIDLEMIS